MTTIHPPAQASDEPMRAQAEAGFAAFQARRKEFGLPALAEKEGFMYGFAAAKNSARATADVERDGGALHDALMKCAKELPEGYTVRVEVEFESGWVEWSGPDCDGHAIEGEGHLSDDVTEAFNAIIAESRK